MLDAADLEVNVLEFRQRAFQFERLAELDGAAYAVFSRTETETESRFRPKLVHLRLVVPHAWVVLDAAHDVLAIARDGSTVPPRRTEPVVEVAAEPAEFREQGVPFRRAAGPNGTLVYAPTDRAERVLTPAGYAALGIA